MSITVNILGSCVSRDAFGLFDNDAGFDVKQCVLNSCFVSICSPPIAKERIAEMDDFKNSCHFHQRCAMLDINKNVMDYISEYDCDYLVVDLATVHKVMFKIKRLEPEENSNYTFITAYDKAYKQNPSFIKNNDKIQLVDTLSFIPEHKNIYMMYLKKFANMLKELYPQKKLIIVELHYANHYFDGYGKIQEFSQSLLHQKNVMLDSLYAEMKKILPDAHYIKFPDCEVFANKRHKWKLHVFHFVYEYYEYLINSIKLITSDLKDEKLLLDALHKKYSDIIRKKYLLNRYSLKNMSKPDKTEITLGESINFSLKSKGGSGICYYGVYYKTADETEWSVLTRDNYEQDNILWTPENIGEYTVILKVRDSNNFIERTYLKISVR